MPAINPNDLVNAIIDAFQESGTTSLLVSSINRHPRKFVIQAEFGGIEAWIYAWTLTHGGRPNLPDEYRIQLTTISSPLLINPDGYTLLLGYEPNLKMWAGFDLRRHRLFTSGSPSVQIDIKCMYKALQDGLAFDRKSNNEIAIGIRPDQLVNYAANADELHRVGSASQMYGLLTKATSLELISKKEISVISQNRKRLITKISRLSRNANFRQKVLNAYGNRCAVTRMQLRLVDAAHILPVGVEGSTDSVQNGIALSPTFHRAFDTSLVFIDECYIMRINPKKELQIVTLALDDGLVDFKNIINKTVHLPADRSQWPELRFIRKANEYRRIHL